MTTLYTQEILDAAVALLKAATLSFSPKLIQDGDLVDYPEKTLPNIIPAVLVKAVDADISIGEMEIGGRDVDTFTGVRVVVVDDYSDTEFPHRLRISRAQEVAEAFITSAMLDMDESIANYEVFSALPKSMELQPGESALVGFDGTRKLFAIAVNVLVHGRASR